MSSDETPNIPAARPTREAVREKAQKVHARQSRARIMRRIIIGVVSLVVLAGIGVGVALAVGSSITKPALNPTGMQDDGVTVREITAGSAAEGAPSTASPSPTDAGASATPSPTPTEGATEPTEIHIYIDYLSASAGEFERANARQLAGWIAEGAVTVTYHPVALLTANSSGTKYSLRAASAAACVATHSPGQFYDYNHELLTDQPELDTEGPTDVELADLAVAVGAEKVNKVRSCIENQDFVAWAKNATARALEGPLPGSKDLKLNNETLVVVAGQAYVGAMDDPAEFSQFVLTTASHEYNSSKTPTPTPTPTPSGTPAT